MRSLFREYKDFPLQLSMILCDVLLIVLSFIAAYFFRHRLPGIPGPGFYVYYKSILIVTILWIAIFAYFGLYRIRRSWRYSEVVFNSALAVTVGMVLYLAVSYMLKEFFFSRLLLVVLWGVNVILFSGSRAIFRLILLRIRRAGYGIRRILIVGNTASSKMLTKAIELHPELGYRIIGYLTPEGAGETNGAYLNNPYSYVGATSTVIEGCRELKPDEAIFTLPIGKREELWAMINSFQKEGIEVRIIPDIYDFLSGRMVMDDLEGVPMIRFRPITPQSWERIFKLGLDYVGSIVLILLLSPLILYIVLRLKFSSGDGVLTKETVIGLLGRPFNIYRFRIPMKPVFSNPSKKSAPTLFGEFLYRYSISDLPQLINVLKGDMSLVGPRPESPIRVERYSEFHRRRLVIKPGITGLAQVNGLRGFDSSDEKTRFDLKYIEEHSVFLDMKILLQTIWILLKRHSQPISSFPLRTE